MIDSSTKSSDLTNKSDELCQSPNNIDLPILKGSLTVIPNTISVSCVSSSTGSNNDLHINKLAKYRFPNMDVIDPESDCTQYSKMQSLENILNISVCSLNPTNHRFWSNLAQRDYKAQNMTLNKIFLQIFQIFLLDRLLMNLRVITAI